MPRTCFTFFTLCFSFHTSQNLLAFSWSLVLLVGLFHVVPAAPNDDPFSGITFRAFSEFVEQQLQLQNLFNTSVDCVIYNN